MDFHKNQSEAGKGVNMLQTFTICFTSDTHGHIFPVNYAANHYEDSGLLNLAAQDVYKRQVYTRRFYVWFPAARQPRPVRFFSRFHLSHPVLHKVGPFPQPAAPKDPTADA